MLVPFGMARGGRPLQNLNFAIVFCIDKQMGHYELITACFFLKISSKKSTFLRFTHQNLLTPPHSSQLLWTFFPVFFWWLPLSIEHINIPYLLVYFNSIIFFGLYRVLFWTLNFVYNDWFCQCFYYPNDNISIYGKCGSWKGSFLIQTQYTY